MNKQAIARALPPGVAHQARRAYGLRKLPDRLRAQVALRLAVQRSYLDASALDEMASQCSAPPEYGYDPATLEARGHARAAELLALPGATNATSFLELGCWDGMVGYALKQAGKHAIGIDSRADGFDLRALRADVDLRVMDAADAPLIPDQSINVIYSYDAFEHFPTPDRVLAEVERILAPGGICYLDFGPLYYAPWGAHAYRSVPVPYCQLLWPRDTLDEWVAAHDCDPIDWQQLNGWPAARFRDLFRSSTLDVVWLRESLDLDHLDLIRRHPQCFAGLDFHDLLVKQMRVLLRRL